MFEVKTDSFICYAISISTELYNTWTKKLIKFTYEYQLCYYGFLIKYNNNVRKWSQTQHITFGHIKLYCFKFHYFILFFYRNFGCQHKHLVMDNKNGNQKDLGNP